MHGHHQVSKIVISQFDQMTPARLPHILRCLIFLENPLFYKAPFRQVLRPRRLRQLVRQPFASTLPPTPLFFSNELEYFYTGKGFGEAFEFLFDSSESRAAFPNGTWKPYESTNFEGI
jgi:hypothetical protein